MRPNRSEPYIGITGFTTAGEINGVLDVLPRYTYRQVMVGVLVSSKTLRGIPNKWPQRYPKPEKLSQIFTAHRKALNLIHFNTKEPERLLDDMLLAQSMAGPNCHGFQLNIAWPDKGVLKQYRDTKPEHASQSGAVVLQVGSKALDECGRDPTKIAERVHEYEYLADFVLIDPSGGVGQEFDVDFTRQCFIELESKTTYMGFGIAGGLHAGNLDRLAPLLEDFSFSIDAEGKLRNVEDNLDVEAAKAYLKSADEKFRQYEVAV
ncbi:MAG: Uncharacterized protein G01um101456_241 [Parcubacteria group bacterium Gr01-1014_56]|nr:MAG: Uncharacterized protein G01um101456_241 [Parcubacteria group bacterium Gr01-1014_56]